MSLNSNALMKALYIDSYENVIESRQMLNGKENLTHFKPDEKWNPLNPNYGLLHNGEKKKLKKKKMGKRGIKR